MTVAAGSFPWQKVVTLKAGSRRRRRSVVYQEEEAAVALGYSRVLALKPRCPMNTRLYPINLCTVAVPEWITDHG